MHRETSDETIRRVLSTYAIGQKLRRLRLRRKIALVDLSVSTGLSASMLSQLETGRLIPTLPTLARLAEEFKVDLGHFLTGQRSERTFSIVRAGQRIRFPEVPASELPTYEFEVLAFGMPEKEFSPYLADFPKIAAKEDHSHTHDGGEFVHVLEGVLAIRYAGEEHLLKAGDSVYFDGSEPHSYAGQSDPPAKAIVITFRLRL